MLLFLHLPNVFSAFSLRKVLLLWAVVSLTVGDGWRKVPKAEYVDTDEPRPRADSTFSKDEPRYKKESKTKPLTPQLFQVIKIKPLSGFARSYLVPEDPVIMVAPDEVLTVESGCRDDKEEEYKWGTIDE